MLKSNAIHFSFVKGLHALLKKNRYFPSVCLVAWREVSVVDKMTALRVQRFGVGIPVGSRVLYPLQEVQKVSGVLPAYY
jgi:hypothetical protein